ncbi:hypothetical protein Pla52o_11140 [Novipirellula galeiformis]|uniref:Uncharacterized protein n=1 Tax=Novipirellula galeiformis TaxID=2528004 RepID=A0A5C6CMW6_9BACT|nr:hypothetical protein Pla52o_11140 [Novipirellula galeiformis]
MAGKKLARKTRQIDFAGAPRIEGNAVRFNFHEDDPVSTWTLDVQTCDRPFLSSPRLKKYPTPQDESLTGSHFEVDPLATCSVPRQLSIPEQHALSPGNSSPGNSIPEQHALSPGNYKQFRERSFEMPVASTLHCRCSRDCHNRTVRKSRLRQLKLRFQRKSS